MFPGVLPFCTETLLPVDPALSGQLPPIPDGDVGRIFRGEFKGVKLDVGLNVESNHNVFVYLHRTIGGGAGCWQLGKWNKTQVLTVPEHSLKFSFKRTDTIDCGTLCGGPVFPPILSTPDPILKRVFFDLVNSGEILGDGTCPEGNPDLCTGSTAPDPETDTFDTLPILSSGLTIKLYRDGLVPVLWLQWGVMFEIDDSVYYPFPLAPISFGSANTGAIYLILYTTPQPPPLTPSPHMTVEDYGPVHLFGASVKVRKYHFHFTDSADPGPPDNSDCVEDYLATEGKSNDIKIEWNDVRLSEL